MKYAKELTGYSCDKNDLEMRIRTASKTFTTVLAHHCNILVCRP